MESPSTSVNSTANNQEADRLIDSDRWFKPELERSVLGQLSQRNDKMALRRTLAYFALLLAFGVVSVVLWVGGSWWFLASYVVFCYLWSFTNACGHEACHYTPFRSLRLNNALLYVCSWMQNWEPVTLRFIHARHHTYTSQVGADAEYLLPNPIKRRDLANLLTGTNHFWNYNKELVQLAVGRPNELIREAVPAEELPLTKRNARVFLLLYAAVIGVSLALWNPLPFIMLMLPRIVGEPMHGVLRALQHGGLETEVADHRRTTRSMYVSKPLQWLYWNMNFHIEHHMYPMVPFHALPELHLRIADQLPAPTKGVRAGMGEIFATMRAQRKDPNYRMPGRIPDSAETYAEAVAGEAGLRAEAGSGGLNLEAVGREVAPLAEAMAGEAYPVAEANDDSLCAVEDIPLGDVLGLERDGVSYAVCRTLNDEVFVVSDICTHHSARLSEGVLIDCEIECPMHQGRFDITTGEATRRPARRPLATYSVRVRDGRVSLADPKPAEQETT